MELSPITTDDASCFGASWLSEAAVISESCGSCRDCRISVYCFYHVITISYTKVTAILVYNLCSMLLAVYVISIKKTTGKRL